MSGKKKFSNTLQERFLGTVPLSLTSSSGIGKKCAFNFSFFDENQDHACSWDKLGNDKILSLIDKLKHYTNDSLEYWKREKLLVEYGDFPPKGKTDFNHPRHVPADVRWARFRVEGAFRLIGFLIPSELHNEPCENNGVGGEKHFYNRNVFYVVFLDPEHRFWKS